MVQISARSAYLLAVCVFFLVAGTIATIFTKWADLQEAPDAHGNISSFEHPFFQTLVMFCGEIICLGAFRLMVWKKRADGNELKLGEDYSNPINPLWFAVPAVADFTASTTCNIALTLTSASVYQMLRGSTVLFIALFSYFFLHRRFFRHEYLGMFIVISGLTVVGVSASLRKTTKEASNPVLGNILVVVGQIIQSAQFVLEESWMKKHCLPPTYMVGWEGIFGAGITVIALALFQAFHGKPDDIVVTFEQVGNCWTCGLATFLVLCACPVFNGTANTITKELSAATRMVLDALRNILVWVVTMTFASTFNESFDWLQMVGFCCLVAGGAVYRRLLRIPHPFFDVAMERLDMLNDGESQPELEVRRQSGYATLEDHDMVETTNMDHASCTELSSVASPSPRSSSMLASNGASLHESL